MANDSTGPFFRRFETPGIAATDTQNLTIAEAVKGLLRSNLLGRVLGKKARAPGFLTAPTDSETLVRARKILNGYFRALMETNLGRWQKGRAAYICVNPGIRAHFQLIQEILQYLQSRGTIDPVAAPPEKVVAVLVEFIEPLRSYIANAGDKQVEEKFSRKFGEGGVVQYFYNLCEIVARKQKDFGSEEFRKFTAQQADARVEQIERDVSDLQSSISAVVIETLKKIHGTEELRSGEKAYWDLGIENLDIKQAAYKKQQSTSADKRAPKEAYLDLIDFDKIIRQSNNWPQFEPIFNIQLSDEQKGKKYYLQWLERLNEIRRISAHKTRYRTFADDDFEFIGWIKAQLFDRFSRAGFDPSSF
jgi:DNA sulfur modification protein DndB